MRDFNFKRRAWKLLTRSDHLTPRQFKLRKSAWEKGSVPIQYLRSDEMLTGFMSVSLFHVIFVTCYEIKSLSPQKKLTILSCQMCSAHFSIARANSAPHCTSLQNADTISMLQDNKSTVPINRPFFAECFIVLISDYRGQLQFLIFFIFCVVIHISDRNESFHISFN